MVLHLLAIVGYFGAWLLQLRGLEASAEDEGSRPAFAVTAAAAAIHAAALVVFALQRSTLPLVGLGPASSSLALVIALSLLAASSVRAEARPAGLFVLPFVLLLMTEAAVVGLEPAPRQTSFRGPWFVFHIGAVFLGYAGLLLASAASLMYLLQFRALKQKRFGSVFRFFPSLETLDELNRVGLLVGFPALTLGLVAGWGFTTTYGQGLALGDPEVLFGIVTWLAYAGPILARLGRAWPRERSALASVGALAVIVGAFVALRLTATPPGFFL